MQASAAQSALAHPVLAATAAVAEEEEEAEEAEVAETARGVMRRVPRMRGM